jgi:hypothetical protein
MAYDYGQKRPRCVTTQTASAVPERSSDSLKCLWSRYGESADFSMGGRSVDALGQMYAAAAQMMSSPNRAGSPSFLFRRLHSLIGNFNVSARARQPRPTSADCTRTFHLPQAACRTECRSRRGCRTARPPPAHEAHAHKTRITPCHPPPISPSHLATMHEAARLVHAQQVGMPSLRSGHCHFAPVAQPPSQAYGLVLCAARSRALSCVACRLMRKRRTVRC